jgi:hypothetical protein
VDLKVDLRHPLAAARDLRRRAGRTVRRLRDRSRLVLPDEAELLRALGGRFGTVGEALRPLGRLCAPFLPEDLTRAAIASYYEERPAAREALLGAARRVLEHRLDLLGSGPVVLGAALPWHADFKGGHVYDPSVYYEDLRDQVTAQFGTGREVKIPWELSRCQHLPLLGQAFRLTSDPAYYEEFRREIVHWIGENRVGRGVNWTCTMDVAIRAVNWIWAGALFREAVADDQELASLLVRSLLAHGRFIAANLEDGGGAPASNHYYADLLGLLFLGVLFRGAPEADDWRGLAAAAIEAENAGQTYPDGVDYEASIAYHRLMTEMTLTALIVMERSGLWRPLLHERARRMAGFVAHYLKPSGMAPQIGDNDDGRLQILGEHGADRRDHRPLLAVAGCLLNDPALLALAEGRTEEALWLLGPDRLRRLLEESGSARVSLTSALFPQAGVAVLRHGDLYAILDAGTVGLGGQGAHAHNDTLSVEIQAGGEDLIVDPGTGVYTPDLAVRDAFRGTAAHNTVRVDGEEINPLPAEPFALPGIDQPVVTRALLRRNFDLVEAEHGGYMRLPDPVRHRRVVLLNRVARRFLIEDRLEGRARHRIEWFFHLAPGVEVALADGGRVARGRAGRVRFALEGSLLPPGARLRLSPDRFSPGYGRIEPSLTLVCEWEGMLPVTARFTIFLAEPREPAASPEVEERA